MCRIKDTLKRQEPEIKVKIYKKYILKLTRQSKANHFNNFFQENRLNLFETREGMREITNITKKETKDINCIQILNKTIAKPTEIANELNNHFSSIAKNIEDKLIKPNFGYSNYLRNRSEQSFFISSTNAEEVLSEIKNRRNNISIGPSSVPTKFLKLFQTSLSEPVALIANLSF